MYGLKIPEFICVFLDGTVSRKVSAASGVEKRHSGPLFSVGVSLYHFLVGKSVGLEVCKTHIGVCNSVTCQKIGCDVSEGLACKADGEEVYYSLETLVVSIELCGAIAAKPHLLNLVCLETEDVHIILANSIEHLNVSTVKSTYGDSTVYHKLHTARTTCFLTCKRDLLAYISGRNEYLSRTYVVVLKEHYVELFLDSGVLVDILRYLAKELDYSLCHLISGSRLCSENKGLRSDIEIGILLEIKVESDDIERIEKLTLIFVQALDLNVEDRMSIDLLARLMIEVIGKCDFVIVLYSANSVKNGRVVSELCKFSKLYGIVSVSRTDSLVKKLCKLGVGIAQPTTVSYTVGYVFKAVRIHLVEVLEYRFGKDIRVKL